MFHTRLRRAAAVALLMGAAAVVGPLSSGAAEASSCPGTAGVTVVVEFHELGRGSAQSCVADGGGRTADRLLKEAGYALDYVQRFPGFVCRVDGAPADDPCVNTPPADAYWGLWWSDGSTGKWTYSSLGAASLAVPAGGYVAMVWDGSTGTVAPTASAAVHPTPTPAPTQQPTPTPTATPTVTPSSTPTTADPSTTPSPTKEPSSKPTKKPTKKPTTAPSTPASDSPIAAPTEEPTDLPPSEAGDGPTDDGGLPGWVPPVLVVVLLGVAGAVAVVRRRR